jgi:hypothetical protein
VTSSWRRRPAGVCPHLLGAQACLHPHLRHAIAQLPNEGEREARTPAASAT